MDMVWVITCNAEDTGRRISRSIAGFVLCIHNRYWCLTWLLSLKLDNALGKLEAQQDAQLRTGFKMNNK